MTVKQYITYDNVSNTDALLRILEAMATELDVITTLTNELKTDLSAHTHAVTTAVKTNYDAHTHTVSGTGTTVSGGDATINFASSTPSNAIASDSYTSGAGATISSTSVTDYIEKGL